MSSSLKHSLPPTALQLRFAVTVGVGVGLILDIDVLTTQAFACGDKVLEDHLAKMRWLKDKAFFLQVKKQAIRKLGGGKK